MSESIAIVGTGVAGLGCAWNLRDVAKLTLFEKQERPGGHTNTVHIEENGRRIPIDTGFIVFNHVTYPRLVALFEELGVETKPSEMSFSVRHEPSGIEYNGMGADKVFAQRRNILRPRFHLLLLQILRFFRLGRAALTDPATEAMTLREFALRHRLGQDFLDLYLVPMSSAVWSTEPGRVLEFPARSLLRFFHNHGFLGVTTHHPWFTVSGGAKTYVDRILEEVKPLRLSCGVRRIAERRNGVEIETLDGARHLFDRVVLAAHADEALAMLESPTPDQRRLLGAFRYQKNSATLHTDASVMPRRRRAWASWNYRVAPGPDGHLKATTHYWMNALQGVSTTRDYFVSIEAEIPDEHVLYRTVYEHPVFTLGAMRAQRELATLNEVSADQRTFFCGSYFRYGFHEDAYSSAVDTAAQVRRVVGP